MQTIQGGIKMSRKKVVKDFAPPPDGAKLVWDLHPGDSFRDTVREKGKIQKEIDARYMKTGDRVRIVTISEDEIEVSL
jgi:hypothetical protein